MRAPTAACTAHAETRAEQTHAWVARLASGHTCAQLEKLFDLYGSVRDFARHLAGPPGLRRTLSGGLARIASSFEESRQGPSTRRRGRPVRREAGADAPQLAHQHV